MQSQEVYRQQQIIPQYQNSPYQIPLKSEPDFIRPEPDLRNPILPRLQHYDQQPLLPYQQYPQQQTNGWIPHQSNQMPPPIPQLIGKNFLFNLYIKDKLDVNKLLDKIVY